MTVIVKSLKNYQVEIVARGHKWISDEPLSAGGDDAGPGPYDLFLGSLAACKLITVQMYAQRKGWPLEGIEIQLDIRKINASEPGAKVDLIEGEIEFQGDLTSEQIHRLHEISDRCPVHRTLSSETKIQVSLREDPLPEVVT